MSNNALSNLLPQKPHAAMSSLELSSVPVSRFSSFTRKALQVGLYGDVMANVHEEIGHEENLIVSTYCNFPSGSGSGTHSLWGGREVSNCI